MTLTTSCTLLLGAAWTAAVLADHYHGYEVECLNFDIDTVMNTQYSIFSASLLRVPSSPFTLLRIY